jgi:hypothetical protein
MQGFGYVIVRGLRINVLYRSMIAGKKLKLRHHSGGVENHLVDEEKFLSSEEDESKQALERLLSGITIYI